MTSVEICNVALSQMNLPRITAMTQSTAESIACSLHLQPTINELLEQRPWAWAKKRATLARSTDTNLTQRDYLYALPTDYLLIVRLEDEDGNEITDREIEGDVVATDSDTLRALYVGEVTDHTKLPPSFARAVSMMLGYKLSIDFQMARTLSNEFFQYAQDALESAKRVDARSNYSQAKPARWGDIF